MEEWISLGKTEEEINLLSPLTWAYVGDCVYELYIRTNLVNKTNLKPHKLHIETIKHVKAKAQAKLLEQLQEILSVKIEPAPDEWDRLFNVDFFIKINDKYIGLQIKPVSQVSSIPEIYKEKGIQHKSHIEFTQKYGGKVFYLYSCKQGDKKIIVNTEVIDEIKAEITKLK